MEATWASPSDELKGQGLMLLPFQLKAPTIASCQ